MDTRDVLAPQRAVGEVLGPRIRRVARAVDLGCGAAAEIDEAAMPAAVSGPMAEPAAELAVAVDALRLALLREAAAASLASAEQA